MTPGLQQNTENDQIAFLRGSFNVNSGGLGVLNLPGLTIGSSQFGGHPLPFEGVCFEPSPAMPSEIANRPQPQPILKSVLADQRFPTLYLGDIQKEIDLIARRYERFINSGIQEAVQPYLSFDAADRGALKRRKLLFGGDRDVTIAAQMFALSMGLSDVLTEVLKIVREIMGSTLASLKVDRMIDPDEDFSTLCFAVVSRASVDETLDLDRRLREEFLANISPEARMYFSFVYDFE